MTNYQSDNIYEVNEWDLFEFLQSYTRFLLAWEKKTGGYHPEPDPKDRWLCKYAKRKFKLKGEAVKKDVKKPTLHKIDNDKKKVKELNEIVNEINDRLLDLLKDRSNELVFNGLIGFMSHFICCFAEHKEEADEMAEHVYKIMTSHITQIGKFSKEK